jgi:hypothetical protein
MLPTLSAYDPALTTEGNLDPLGLSLIAEALGNTLAPGIREQPPGTGLRDCVVEGISPFPFRGNLPAAGIAGDVGVEDGL